MKKGILRNANLQIGKGGGKEPIVLLGEGDTYPVGAIPDANFVYENAGKGEKGDKGDKGDPGEKGEKGDQGNSGYSGAAGELEVVNNLVDGGETAALSAEMGKTLSENLQNVEEAIEYTFSERSLYMLGEILRNALYANDQSYNIDELLNTITNKGDYIKVPTIVQDPDTLVVTMTAEAGVTIYYSDNGSIPTKKDGILYSEPFVPVEDCVIKAIAYGVGSLKSLMMSFVTKGSGIIVFKDANLEAVAKAAAADDVVVTLPDSSTTTVKGLGWDKDHDGVITLDDMRQVTSLPAAPGTTFNQNSWIQYLDVLRYARFTSCGRYSFNKCPNLKELTIPKTCTTTQAESILQCTSLQRLVFEEGVTSVGQIKNCTIAKMKLPDSLTSFGGITGCGTSLKNAGGLVIPKNVTAFPNVYNTKVGRIKHLGNITTIPMNNLSYAGNTEVYLASNTVPTKTGTASQGAITKLYVPDDMIPLYAESEDWASLYSSGKIVSINNWVD